MKVKMMNKDELMVIVEDNETSLAIIANGQRFVQIQFPGCTMPLTITTQIYALDTSMKGDIPRHANGYLQNNLRIKRNSNQ